MIGTISTGKSFYHCLSYCLEDKQKLSQEQKTELSKTDGVSHLSRAEVLEYNLCFGNKYELADQFRDVQRLSKRVEKPVIHLSLRLSPGEVLTKEQLTRIGQDLAKEFDLQNRQYVTILHKDTKEPHIHLVGNRVGTSGKAISTSHNYMQMDRLCRRLEKEYRLKEVLSARKFLSKEQRLIPRKDIRKEKLAQDIRQTLKKVNEYSGFQEQMQALGYTVSKGRGISFIDDKKVKIKGSEVAFSLQKIERILFLKQKLESKSTIQRQQPIVERQRQILNTSGLSTNPHKNNGRMNESHSTLDEIKKELADLTYELLKNEEQQEMIPEELLQKKKYRKKHRIKP